MTDFFYMGGFGAFIWSAMGVAAVLMILEPLVLIMRKKVVIKQIKQNNQRESRLEKRRNRASNNRGTE